jgi:hypothetical protein
MLVRMQEISMELPQKTKIKTPYDPAMPLLDIYLRNLNLSIHTTKTPAQPCS